MWMIEIVIKINRFKRVYRKALFIADLFILIDVLLVEESQDYHCANNHYEFLKDILFDFSRYLCPVKSSN